MRLTELLKMKVVAEDGRYLGQVAELRCAGEPEHGDSRPARIVTELIYGKAGWLERLGFRSVKEQHVAWAAVTAIEDGKITIREEGRE